MNLTNAPVRQDFTDGDFFGNFEVQHAGYGYAQVRDLGQRGRVIQLRPAVDPGPSGTLSTFVTSQQVTQGDVEISLELRTLSQHATSRRPAEVPNPWETGWVMRNRTSEPGQGEQGTGIPSENIERSYYFALKTDGWELGKLDQGVFVNTGGQRYLATGTDVTFPVGYTWHDVVIVQQLDTITVTVDGNQLVQFTDGPGSGGSPAWSAHPDQEVYRSGSVGLYTEDARVQFDDVAVGIPTQ